MKLKLNTELLQMTDDEWETPVSFDKIELPKFPVEIFPSWLREYIESVADASQTPIDASGMFALSVLSTALAKKFIIKPYNGSWVERNNLYTVVVMPSGERKSVVYNLLSEPILEFEKQARLQAKKQLDEAVDGKESIVRLPRCIADDVTPEKLVGLLTENNEHMAILSSEGGLFESLNGRYSSIPNLDVYLKGYSGDLLTVDRVNRPSETLYEPILTIGLFVQPSVLQELPERLAERGLLGRFLYAIPESLRGKRDVTPKRIDPSLAHDYNDKIKKLLRFNTEEPITLSLDEQAQQMFLAFLETHEIRLGDEGDLSHDFLRSWTDRFPGHLLRIASLVHIAEQIKDDELTLDSISPTISADIMHRILYSREYFIEHTKAAMGCVKSDEELEDAKYLLNVLNIEEGHEFKKQDVWKRTKGKFNKAEYLDNALKILFQRGYIRIVYSDSPSGRGRKGTAIVMNPKVKPFKKHVRLEVNQPANPKKKILPSISK